MAQFLQRYVQYRRRRLRPHLRRFTSPGWSARAAVRSGVAVRPGDCPADQRSDLSPAVSRFAAIWSSASTTASKVSMVEAWRAL